METERKVGLVEMTLFTVCGILVIDTFVAPAILGVAGITIWLITALFYFLPYGLVNAELGAAYPEDGGIFNWVKRAYGDFWATLVGWFYWFNVSLWMPAVYVAFVTWFSYAFFPDMPKVALAGTAIALSWLTAYIGVRGVELGVKFTNLGAIIKVGILLLFGIMGAVYGVKFGYKSEFSLAAFIPSLDNALLYAPAIVYNFCGFELISSIASKIEDPGKNIPKMTILAGVLIAGLYVVGTFGILAAIPADQIDPVNGFLLAAQELTTIFGAAGPLVFKLIVGAGCFSLITNMISWTMGGTEVLSAADLDSKAPGLLGHKHPKYDTPDYSYYILASVSTAMLALNYSLSDSAAAIFWTILAFSFIIFLMPYLFLFPAAVKLRRIDKNINRPYRIPGGEWGIKVAALSGELFVILAIVLLFLPSDRYNPLVYYPTLIIGTIISIAIGVGIYKNGQKRSAGSSVVDKTEKSIS